VCVGEGDGGRFQGQVWLIQAPAAPRKGLNTLECCAACELLLKSVKTNTVWGFWLQEGGVEGRGVGCRSLEGAFDWPTWPQCVLANMHSEHVGNSLLQQLQQCVLKGVGGGGGQITMTHADFSSSSQSAAMTLPVALL